MSNPFSKKQRAECDRRLGCPPGWDEWDRLEAKIEEITDTQFSEIVSNPEELREVLFVANPNDMLALAQALAALIGFERDGRQYPLTDERTTGQRVKSAATELIRNASREAAKEELRCRQ